MLICKVYDNWQKANTWMKYYCEYNQSSIEKVTQKDMTVHLLTGDRIMFRVVASPTDIQNLSGYEVQWMELDPGSKFDYEAESWLKTRVRTPARMIKEK